MMGEMSIKARDLSGKVFTHLTVLLRAANDKRGKAQWLCLCDCGKFRIISVTSLTKGDSRSCGHLAKELTRLRFKGKPGLSKTHGMSDSPLNEYNVWTNMKARCGNNPQRRDYKFYAGRGIKVCERWLHSFENFYADMGPRPSLKHTIDRIDGDKDYEPSNCRWATWTEQRRNRDDAVTVMLDGERVPLIVAANALGLTYTTLHEKLRKDPERRVVEDVRSWGSRVRFPKPCN